MAILSDIPRRQVPLFWLEADPVQKVAMVVGAVLVLLALLTPLIAPVDPNAQSLIARLRPPIWMERGQPGHLLGTDELGRDVLIRALYGLRLTLMLAVLGATLGLLIGGTLGLLAGMVGGRTEAVVMGAVDAQIAVPFTLIALFLLTVLGNAIEVMVIVLGLAGWEQYARIVRAEVRRLMRLPFIEAAHCAGAAPLWIASRHLLPNLVSPLVVQPPTATLGAMVGVGRDYMPTAPWIVLVPALFILSVTFVVQILGDWLRDRADVRLRSR